MKKYLILTSVLALAACGGGSGGGHGTPVDTPRAAVADTAIESNTHVTSMASEILIPKSGTGEIIARSGSVNYNGLNYTSYRLDDVNFRVATGGGNDALLNFKMDNTGKIDALTVDVGGGKQKLFRRDDNSADFRGIVYEYVLLEESATEQDTKYDKSDRDTLVRLVYSETNDPNSFETLRAAADGKCPQNRVCRWDRIDQAFRITSKGNGDLEDDTDNLRYSDFGMLQTSNFGKYKDVTSNNFAEAKTHTRDKNGNLGEAKTWNNIEFSDADYDVFGGGYKIPELQHMPTETMDFTGTAIGSIYATNSDTHENASRALQDNNATLHFEDGTERLTMSFANWYGNVVVTKNASGNNIAFGGEFIGILGDNGNGFRRDASLDKPNFTITTGDASQNGGTRTEGLLDMGYYGKTGPEEATGVVRFKETTRDDDVQYEREFRASYGMKPVD